MNTQAHVRNETQILAPVMVPVDFDQPAPQVQNLPSDLFDVDRLTALVTAAQLFSHPDPELTDKHCLSVAYLSMFGAGARVKLTRQQFRQLERTALDFAAVSYEQGQSQAASAAMFAVRQGKQRASSEGVIGERPVREDVGLAEVDFECGRGYGVIGSGLSAEFDETAGRADRLLTYAALFAHSLPQRTNSSTQAVVYLALWALGSRVSLSKQQFRCLERRVKTYLSCLKSPGFAHLPNGRRAHYVLVQALRRARKDGLI